MLKKIYWLLTNSISRKYSALYKRAKGLVPKTVKHLVKKRLYVNKPQKLREIQVVQEIYNGPIISVIIPCYNSWEFLDEAVKSVLSQTVTNSEIIIVDDGSTDPKTIDHLDLLKQPKVCIYHTKNQGVAEARNFGIDKSKGKYICCLDSDDYLEPTYFEKAISIMEANPSLSFVYPDARTFGDEDGYWRVQDFSVSDILAFNHVTVVAVFQREMWQEIGGYSTDMKEGLEDWDFWIKTGLGGFRGKAINEPLFNWRRHGKTRNTEAEAKHYKILKDRLKNKYKKLQDPSFVRHIKSKYCDSVTDNAFINFQNYKVEGVEGSLLYIINAEPSTTLIDEVRAAEVQPKVILNFPNPQRYFQELYQVTPFVYNAYNYFPRHQTCEEFIAAFKECHKPGKIIEQP